jgi:hypothetical protein
VVIGVLTEYLGSIKDLGGRIALLGLAALVLVPPTALAADPATHQYGSSLDQISQGGAGGVGGVGSAGAAGETGGGAVTSGLPFTGLDLVLLAAVAAALVVAGLLLRRRRAEASEA